MEKVLWEKLPIFFFNNHQRQIIDYLKLEANMGKSNNKKDE